MTSRERVRRVLEHKEVDRVPIMDSPWQATVARWRREGLGDFVEPADYFGYEIAYFGMDLSPGYPTEVLEENETYIIERLATGEVRKNFRDYSTTPEIIDWPIKKKDDWLKIKERLKPDYTRVDWITLRNSYHREKSKGRFLCIVGGYGYDILQRYIKSEELLILMVEDPDWVREMIETFGNLFLRMTEIIMEKGYEFDGAFLYNDMGYRNGLLFSPTAYLQTHFDMDRKVCEFFHSRGMKVILHSCGNVSELIPHLIEAGFDCLQPLEVKAGMDVRVLKKEFGDRLSFMGNIDVRKMSDPDPEVIEEEIREKFKVAKVGGGYIYHSDHSVPKDVSFSQYKRVIELARKYGVY